MAMAKSRKIRQQRPIPLRAQKLISRQIQKQQVKQIRGTVLEKVRQIVPSTQQKPNVNYSSAWETAMKHFNKGMAGAYLYWMGRDTNPQTRAVYKYVKELVKQQRSGNISPTGTKLAHERVKLTMFPEIARQEQQAAIAKYNKSHPSLIANRYKLSTSASDILSGKIFQGVGAIKDDVPVEARLKPSDIAAIIKGKDIGKIINEKRNILENISIRETNKFKISLENSSKELPTGVSFAKDNKGNIVGIIDRNKNRRVPLSSLNRYISDNKLVKLGLGSMIKFNAQELTGKVKITSSNIPGKIIVEFPNGQKGTINSQGRVVVGARLAGHQYIFQDGVIRKVDGVDLYEEKLKPVEVSRRDQIINFKLAKDLSKKWEQDIAVTKGILTNAAQRGDTSRLAELQRLGSERTTAQNQELFKLQTETAKNYKLGGELVGKIIGTSLINMGVGSKELYDAIKENPKETLMALPPAIYLGVKEDFNRVMSGDPLEIASVGLEYWTFSRVAKILGKVGKTGLKTSYGIGSTLSPKYFGAISKKLLIPPITLRRVAVKTATGRAVEEAIKKSLKQKGVTGKVTAFNKKLKGGKTKVDLKLDRIKRRASKVKKEQKKVIGEFKKVVEYGESLQRAKKLRNKKLNYWRIQWTKKSFKSSEAMFGLEKFARDSGRLEALLFLKNKANFGRKLGKTQSELFIKTIEESFVRTIRNTENYKFLLKIVKTNREFSIKIPKVHRIAKKQWNSNIRVIKNMKAIKILNSAWDKAVMGALKPIKKVKSVVVGIKGIKGKVVRKLKSELEYGKQLREARKIKRGEKILRITKYKGKNWDYVRGVDFMYNLSDSVAILRVLEYLKFVKKRGMGKGLTRVQWIELKANLKNKAIKINREILEKSPGFRELKKLARYESGYARELIRNRKISPVTLYINKLKVKLNKAKKKIDIKIKEVKIEKRKIKIRAEREVKFERLRAEKLEKYIKSNRYLMDVQAAKNLKVITRSQLTKTKTLKQYNRLVDELFDELSKRRKVDINTLQYRQLRNSIKRNLKKAYNRRDMKILNDFKSASNRVITELNYPGTLPTIRVVRKVRIKTPKMKKFQERKEFHIIKDFKPQSPKGQYKEVKVGNQILLKKMKPLKFQDVKVKKKVQVLKVVQVSKKSISLMPLVRFSLQAMAGEIAANLTKHKPKFDTAVTSKNIFGLAKAYSPTFANDIITLKKFIPVTQLKKALVQEFKKAKVYSTRKITITEKKMKVVRIRLQKKFTKKKIPKAEPVFYIKVKKKGKMVNLLPRPLILKDAKDYLAYKVDKRLISTAYFEPIGRARTVVRIPANMRGYFIKVKKKLRPYRIRVGKKKLLRNGYIEKRRFRLDTQTEKAQLKIAREKALHKRKKKRILTKKLK